MTFTNQTCIPLSLYLLSTEGDHFSCQTTPDQYLPEGTVLLPANGQESYTRQDSGTDWYWLFTNSYTGAFAAAVRTPESGSVTITSFDLLDPNDIGLPPKPGDGVIIPQDSPSIMVGCGELETGNVVVREQYWQRLPDSYSIAAGAKRTISYTTTAGMESTTSEQSHVAESVTGSATAGWGPVSATLTASLSNDSTTFQQASTNVETTAYVSQTYDNSKGVKSRTCFYWQLTNVLTMFDSTGNALASLVYGAESPAVIDVHSPDDLPPRPLEKELPMSADMRARLSWSPPTAAAGPVLHRSAP
ncbi:hypothetical protein ACIQK6_19975 [Streptomyces sp. NPDC091682]|uniref:hypothetical protein n=1 Tax=Streptomyces sp. NPDC091682 TaxID=3366005 RepID=UPI00382221DD